MIKIEHLTKAFDKKIIDDFTFFFEKNKVYTIKGRSGCGKTTLLNIISGYDKSYEGLCQRDGSISYICQQSLLIGNMSIRDNLLFICNDNNKIEQYARLFNGLELLDKMPNQLSGGERQRMSIIRAVITQPQIIIADEPTASLDEVNSKIIKDCFCSLRNMGITIIIATHENIFDDVSDAIIFLENKEIVKPIMKNSQEKPLTVCSNLELKGGTPPKGSRGFKYVINKNRNTVSILFIIILAIIQITSFFCIGVIRNYKSEYFKIDSRIHHYHVYSVNMGMYEEYRQKYPGVGLYENYIYNEDGFTVLGLFPEEDSSLSIPNVLEWGEFPKNSGQVIINRLYMNTYFPELSGDEVIGKKIKVNGTDYEIAAVTKSDTSATSFSMGGNAYYWMSGYGSIPQVYLDYDTLSEFGIINPKMYGDVVMKFDEFYKYPEVIEDFNRPAVTVADVNRINSVAAEAVLLGKNVLYIIIVLFLVFIIFMETQISMDIHYRRRELAYLQMFGIKKRRLLNLGVGEYLFKAVTSIIISQVVYGIGCFVIYLVKDMNLYTNIGDILIISLGILIYSTASMAIPMARTLNMEVSECIKR